MIFEAHLLGFWDSPQREGKLRLKW